jgi:MFS family permease
MASIPTRRILFASMIGTTIEFFDFYIYAMAAVLVFPTLFFPKQDPTTATLQSLATFALAFIARPIGSALFGHFGDRIGRKATLVTALLTMGLSTVLIGLLPTYASIGVLAPTLLAPRQRRAGASRTLRAFAAGRDSGVSTRHGARRAGTRTARHGVLAAFA